MSACLPIGDRAVPLWAVGLGSLLVTIAAWAWLPHSVVWIAAAWLGFCVVGVLAPGSTTRRGVCLNLGLVFGVVGGLELYWSFDPTIRDEGSALAGYIVPHEILGYGPTKAYETTLTRWADDQLIYDVTYTIDDAGLRVSPPFVESGSRGECVLFFGGSFMFGEGLENDETMAWQVGVQSDGRYRVHNFGFHGYGPHQMLAALQHGLVDEAIDCMPSHVVYQAGAFHVSRAAGLSSWENGGPRFERTEDDRVEYRGRWNEDRFQYPDWLVAASRDSHLLAKLLTLHRPPNAADTARYIAIVETTRQEIEQRYAGADLIIVYWDAPDDPIPADLESRGFRVLRVSEILTDRQEAPDKYRLHPLDGHPNALAMSRIARALIANLEADALHADPSTQPSTSPSTKPASAATPPMRAGAHAEPR